MHLVLAIAIALTAAPAYALELTGPAHVVDGDTLDVSGERIRLHGIDAPERHQDCTLPGGSVWKCGQASTDAMRAMTEGREVTCAVDGRGRWGRYIGTCYVGKVDVQAELVRSGLAWAYRKYSLDYVDAETEARTASRGVWLGCAVKAWEWRKGERC